MNLKSHLDDDARSGLAAINHLRPDPSRGEIEQLISAGNSFYRGLTLELRKQFGQASVFAPATRFRVWLTMVWLILRTRSCRETFVRNVRAVC